MSLQTVVINNDAFIAATNTPPLFSLLKATELPAITANAGTLSLFESVWLFSIHCCRSRK
ncbi:MULTISPECIES: hypothetical protein [Dickeya]|uniref:hypothetical protein n=1 Tax=Dickeya TaxID=204037 RepID=UPI001CE4C115|nr:hypothetical protein FGI04_16260 [Dickeya zeae]